jgi:hypothetical protein
MIFSIGEKMNEFFKNPVSRIQTWGFFFFDIAVGQRMLNGENRPSYFFGRLTEQGLTADLTLFFLPSKVRIVLE